MKRSWVACPGLALSGHRASASPPAAILAPDAHRRAVSAAVRDELRELVDDYRTRCLWFLRPDLYPETRDQALRMLGYIERYGDLEAFRRAGRIRQRLVPADGEAPERPTLKELLLAEAPRFEIPVPSRKKRHQQAPGKSD